MRRQEAEHPIEEVGKDLLSDVQLAEKELSITSF